MLGFQSAAIIKYAFLEGPAFLAIATFINGGNQFFILISLLLVGWLFFQRPTRDRTESDLMLEGALKNEFQQENKTLE